MARALWLLAFLPACATAACTCSTSFSACHETAESAAVFVGTVESIEPNFLNKWNLDQRTELMHLNEEYARAKLNPSPEALAGLKASYRRVFPNLPEARKRKLE